MPLFISFLSKDNPSDKQDIFGHACGNFLDQNLLLKQSLIPENLSEILLPISLPSSEKKKKGCYNIKSFNRSIISQEYQRRDNFHKPETFNHHIINVFYLLKCMLEFCIFKKLKKNLTCITNFSRMCWGPLMGMMP